MGISEKDIQRTVMRRRCATGDVFLPNFTPYGWWENDVIRVTAAGYWYEYEVKLTRSDFKKDKYKKMGFTYRGQPMGISRGELKHTILARNDGTGPKQFWFVSPEGVVRPDEIPAWAGLMWVDKDMFGRLALTVRKKAPDRKTEKQDAEFINRINYNGAKRYVHDFMYGKGRT